jgi:hypothetical protein
VALLAGSGERRLAGERVKIVGCHRSRARGVARERLSGDDDDDDDEQEE